MILEVLGHRFAYHMEHILRIFYPWHTVQVVTAPTVDKHDFIASTQILQSESQYQCTVTLTTDGLAKTRAETLALTATPKEQQRALSRLLFVLLSEHTKKRPPWGMLMGIRPVGLLRQVISESGSSQEGLAVFQERYFVTPKKARLAQQVIAAQEPLLARRKDNGFSLYINIPFCPSRCLYCSFVSHSIERTAKLVPDYIVALCEELKITGKIAKELGLVLQTIYIGGGTPTAIKAEELEAVLAAVARYFDTSCLQEYTVEAGRPETITPEKLQLLKRQGVSRVSINPQTMQDSVLEAIGRSHTVRDTLEAYALARKAGIPHVNMDFIAGLPGETGSSFLSGIEQGIALKPDNITVHALTVKRSSHLWEQTQKALQDTELPAVIETAQEILQEAGYSPYYLYRQKGTVENLENIGYAKENTASYYNIYSMEEAQTILAVGAGGVTKLWAPQRKIQRIYNHKYPYEYLDDFKGLMTRKVEIRSFYENHR